MDYFNLDAVEKVVKRFPLAVAKQWSHAWCIEPRWPSPSGVAPLGEGCTENEAWLDAARRINK